MAYHKPPFMDVQDVRNFLSLGPFERRGSMVYSNDEGGPGTALCIAECGEATAAETLAEVLNFQWKSHRIRELLEHAACESSLPLNDDERDELIYLSELPKL